MRRRLTAGASSLAVTYLASEVCGLLRIALFAHVLAPASMGVVVILGTWLRFVEMITDLALDRYLLRAPDGASRIVQHAAHGAAIMRGAAGTALMAASAFPLTAIYGLDSELPAFLAASLVPLVRGFTHLDYRLHNRLLRFGSTITIEVVSALIGLVAALSVFAVPGVEAFAAVLLAQAVAAVILSHLLARRAYRIGFHASIQARLWTAGWPLAANALLLFAVFQGEKLFIGGILGLDVLGSYAIAAQLALLPVLIAGRLSTGLALPVLARAGTGTERGAQTREDVVLFFLTTGILFWLGFVALATPVIHMLFGDAYVQSAAAMSWIAAAAALRLQKTGPVTLLLASARSRDILAGNFARLTGLVVGTIGMVVTRDLTVFLAAAAAGEGISYAMAAWRAAPGARSLLLPAPVLAMATAQSFLPYAPQLTLPLASIFAAFSAIVLLRMATRHLKEPRSKLQQAAG
jgi:O-antigen/teichoic acid export membrane protein